MAASHSPAREEARKACKPQRPHPCREWFDEYYREQRIVRSDDDWAAFKRALDAPLPSCFRINLNCPYPDKLRARLVHGRVATEGVQFDGRPVHPPEPLQWYPREFGWQLGMSRVALRKLAKQRPYFKWLHEMVKAETDVGSISRQEAVSMLPPLMLHMLQRMALKREMLQVCTRQILT